MSKKIPDIRFKGYTDAWQQRTLGDVIDSMYNGQTPSRFKDENWNGEINWLSSGELNRGIVTETIEKITPEGKKVANLKVVPAGTFVMAITGLEAAGTRGNCAKLAIDTTLNQSCMALFPNEKLLDSEFLFQWYRKVGEEYGITASRGKWIEKKGIMYMPTWHPAALLRDETKKIEFWKDLKQVKQKADEEKLKI